jgi:predicted DCC family thiol-disulfide oxidoreductase YuxK
MDDAMRLHILYDNSCGLCSHLVVWMSRQPAACELRFVAAGSAEARGLFPELPVTSRPEELVVIDKDGAVYRGDDAYIMCLWALDAYRSVAIRLARPAFRPLARRVFALISTNRLKLSELLGLHSDDAIARTIAENKPSGVPLW